MGYFVVYCLTPKYLGISSYLFITDFLLNSTVARECILYNFNPVIFTDICLMDNYLSYFVKVLCVLEKNVFSAVVSCSILHVSIRSTLFIVFFKYFISFLIFCLLILLIMRSILKSPAVVVYLSISHFNYIYLGFTHFEATLVGAYKFRVVIHSCWKDPFITVKFSLYV